MNPKSRSRILYKELKQYFHARTLAGALATAIVLVLSAAIFLAMTRPTEEIPASGTAMVLVIEAPSPTPSLTPTPRVTATPTRDVPPSPLPGVIAAGAYVQIHGTGGDGLRLRAGAGLDQPVGFLGLESEVFLVVEGPEEKDGYEWWLLESPYDEGQRRRGWAVSNYLSVVQNP